MNMIAFWDKTLYPRMLSATRRYNQEGNHIQYFGRAMAQACVRNQVSPPGICGGGSSTGTGLFIVFRFFLSLSFYRASQYSYCNVLGVLFTMELYCTPKMQYTTVKHSQQLFEHT
jgi:hypothetical protein